LKVGTTLLDEGFHAFDLICGATAPSYGFSLDAQGFVERQMLCAHNGAQHACHGQRRLRSELFGKVEGASFEFVDWVNLMHQADGERGGPIDLLCPQNQVERMSPADGAGQSGRAAPCRNGAEGELGQANLCAFAGRKSEVACERELESAAEAVAEHGGDDWFVELLYRSEYPQPLIENRFEPASIIGV
jgi:hypothetical protein